jgi:hypothetical protein
MLSTVPEQEALLALILTLQAQIRDAVVAACERSAVDELAGVDDDSDVGDTIYAIDRVSEAVLLGFFEREVAPRWPLVLVSEGLEGGAVTLPRDSDPAKALIRVLIDPIDGTRGLMYQKRSAWALTGIAPNKGSNTRLRDIEIAAMTEIPLVKQHLSDVLWATLGQPTVAVRHNRLTGEDRPLSIRPSRAASIAHGFATVSRFFPGAREELAAIDEAVMRAVLGPPPRGKAQCFEDQYICSGGQLYELIIGHDRFVADLRPLMDGWLAGQGRDLGICCHPYDLAALLVAEQAGVIVTDCWGAALDAPLTVEADVGWVGYANEAIRRQIEPVLQAELRTRSV